MAIGLRTGWQMPAPINYNKKSLITLAPMTVESRTFKPSGSFAMGGALLKIDFAGSIT